MAVVFASCGTTLRTFCRSMLPISRPSGDALISQERIWLHSPMAPAAKDHFPPPILLLNPTFKHTEAPIEEPYEQACRLNVQTAGAIARNARPLIQKVWSVVLVSQVDVRVIQILQKASIIPNGTSRLRSSATCAVGSTIRST